MTTLFIGLSSEKYFHQNPLKFEFTLWCTPSINEVTKQIHISESVLWLRFRGGGAAARPVRQRARAVRPRPQPPRHLQPAIVPAAVKVRTAPSTTTTTTTQRTMWFLNGKMLNVTSAREWLEMPRLIVPYAHSNTRTLACQRPLWLKLAGVVLNCILTALIVYSNQLTAHGTIFKSLLENCY